MKNGTYFIFIENLTTNYHNLQEVNRTVVQGLYFNVVLIYQDTGVRGSTRIQFETHGIWAPLCFILGNRSHQEMPRGLPQAMCMKQCSPLPEDMTELQPALWMSRNVFKNLLQQYFRQAGGKVTFNYSSSQRATRYCTRTGGIGDYRDD